ncbi:TIGR03086 family metal-binding protein [Nonomuraea sp. NPDC050790]|uniref:TIGR03086 family metal-binding protein n=1 Tax=Nonomuraea sp. NPDC050790 TaxID=3364371 RepID=UPI0037BA6215
MDDMMPLLNRAAERTTHLVKGVRQEQLSAPTPCAEFDVEALIAHLEWVADLFESLGAKGPYVEQGPYTGDFPDRVGRALAVWSRPEAWEGESPGMGLPMTVLGHMFLVDMVVHGWDLAKATAQPYEPDRESVARAEDFTGQMVEMGRQRGAFGPPVAVPDDAPAFDRLLGLIGRDPAWTAR